MIPEGDLHAMGHTKLDDDFLIVAYFDSLGTAENSELNPVLGLVLAVRLKVHEPTIDEISAKKNWGILSEIHLRKSQ